MKTIQRGQVNQGKVGNPTNVCFASWEKLKEQWCEFQTYFLSKTLDGEYLASCMAEYIANNQLDGSPKDQPLYLYTDKPVQHGFKVPSCVSGKSFDFNENLRYSNLEKNTLFYRGKIRTFRFSTKGDSFFNWAYFANGARGYCYAYRLQDIRDAICKVLSPCNAQFLCIFGRETYDGTSRDQPSNDDVFDYIESVFLKRPCLSQSGGFSFLIIGDAELPCELESLEAIPTGCSIVLEGMKMNPPFPMTVLNLGDLKE